MPEEDYNDFYLALLKWYEIDPRKDKKEWKEFNFRRSVWKEYVEKWVGEDMAREFFNQIIS